MSDQALAALVAGIVVASAVLYAGAAAVAFASAGKGGWREGLHAYRWRLAAAPLAHVPAFAFAWFLASQPAPPAIYMGALWIGGMVFALVGVVGLAAARLVADGPGGARFAALMSLPPLVGGALVIVAMATLGE
ncbi:hypothetical protein [Demequina sp. NBRC 110057]|uniref:hypothetical protein n=1 Tax=Demequina sp. NBRC 110057 TaxID=1570346 RepID=UPI000A037997|nr:hypothetical protein [Demequina sp. NBRC 110057]